MIHHQSLSQSQSGGGECQVAVESWDGLSHVTSGVELGAGLGLISVQLSPVQTRSENTVRTVISVLTLHSHTTSVSS